MNSEQVQAKMDHYAERLGRAFVQRNVLVLFTLLIVPIFLHQYVPNLFPPLVEQLVMPLYTLQYALSFLSLYLFGWNQLSPLVGTVVSVVLMWYLFAVGAAWIGRILARRTALNELRLRYTFSGAFVLAGVFMMFLNVMAIPFTRCGPEPIVRSRLSSCSSWSVARCVSPASGS